MCVTERECSFFSRLAFLFLLFVASPEKESCMHFAMIMYIFGIKCFFALFLDEEQLGRSLGLAWQRERKGGSVAHRAT